MILFIRRQMISAGYMQNNDSVCIYDKNLKILHRWDYNCWKQSIGIELEFDIVKTFKFEEIKL